MQTPTRNARIPARWPGRSASFIALRVALRRMPTPGGRSTKRPRKIFQSCGVRPGTIHLKECESWGEQLALALCSLSWEIFPQRPNQSAGARKLADDALKLLGAAHGEFESSPLHKGDPEPAWLAIIDHFTLNTMVLAFWWHVVKGGMDRTLCAYAQQALHRREELAAKLPAEGIHVKLYPVLAKYALAGGKLDHASLSTIVEVALRDVFRFDRESSFAFDLPITDKVEFKKINGVISALLSADADGGAHQAPG